MDIPEAQPALRRNPTVLGTGRGLLDIDAGRQEIGGRAREPRPLRGQFLGQETYLGELRTDEAGRLTVLGGRGQSRCIPGSQLVDFFNNDGWWDDQSDGPVEARVVLGGKVYLAAPAWAIVAPPNFAPALRCEYRTLYDVVYQAMLEAGYVKAPATVSFSADIFPLFDRLTQLEWVNRGFARRYGWGSDEYYLDRALLARLASPARAEASFRRSLFQRFRPPGADRVLPDALPPVLGDGLDDPRSPRGLLAVTPHQYECLRRWSEGDFVNDLEAAARAAPRTLEELPVGARAAALDRAALEACAGEATHPDCEAPWTLRHARMYSGPFRLRQRSSPAPDWGEVLLPDRALAADGPLAGSQAGDLTKWMSVPWQVDTASCRAAQGEPGLPTFWPARVPNHVLQEADYRQVLDLTLPLERRLEAFRRRVDFFRHLGPVEEPATLRKVVEGWSSLGLVEDRPGPGDAAFPALFKVEVLTQDR